MQTNYYSGINPDVLDRMPLSAKLVLEIGCGAGNLGRAFLSRNPQAQYMGVEYFEEAARSAVGKVTAVIRGDIEQQNTFAAIEQVRQGRLFDTLIFGDVLEHLHDPWKTLAELRRFIQPGGVCVTCIPNIAHWSVLLQQLKGRWDYADHGLLDRTHLRFFTLETALEMFKRAGWHVVDVRPRILWPDKTEEALKAFSSLSQTLNIAPDNLRRDLSAFQWVITAINGVPPSNLNVAAIGIKKIGGVTDARVDYPMAALGSLPSTRVIWSSCEMILPTSWEPGVLIFQRMFMNDAAIYAQIEKLIAKGWIVVSDIDDDPHHWKNFVGNDFFAFRSAHAVTVSTEPLAAVLRQWNPNVKILQNAIFELPEVSASTPKQGERLRIFFGALNREGDWGAVQRGILSAASDLDKSVEFVIVHDRSFFDALNVTNKIFHPTLPHKKYMQVLATCDVALLPLADTQFNRLKSDLKFIECCAAGVVPICSPVVYSSRSEHTEIGFFATTSDEWSAMILAACGDKAELVRRRTLGREYVKRERMQCHQASEREEWYRGLLMNRQQLEAERQLRIRGRGP